MPTYDSSDESYTNFGLGWSILNFCSTLGITADDAEELREIILKVVKTHQVRLGRRDEFGQRYTLDFTLKWQNRSATIRSGWIIEEGFDIARLTTCYLL